MLRLALIDGQDAATAFERVMPRVRNACIAAVACRDVQAARSTAQKLGAEIWAEGLEQLLAEHAAALDAVVIHSPTRLHAEHCQRAAAAGKHILVQPPLAPSAAAAEQVIAACRTAGVRLMVGEPLRFRSDVQTVKASLASGRLGAAGLVRIHRWEPLSPDSAALAKLDHGEADANGFGQLSLVGETDLAAWLFQGRPTAVYAVGCQPCSAPAESHDYVQLHLGFPDGGMALVDHAWTLPPGDGYFSLSVIGSSGAVYADDHHNTHLLFEGGQPSVLPSSAGDSHLAAQLAEFVAAVAENREPNSPGADGLLALQVAEAAAQSLTLGQALTWTGRRYEAVGGMECGKGERAP